MNEHEFLVCCKEKIDENDTESLTNLLENHQDHVRLVGWELVSVIGLSIKNADANEETFENLTKALTTLVKTCTPKEFLLGITEGLTPDVVDAVGKFNFVVKYTTLAFVGLQRGQEKQLMDVWNRLFICCESLLSNCGDLENTNKVFNVVLHFIKTIIVKRLLCTRHTELSQYLMECSAGTLGWSDISVRRCRFLVISFLFQMFELVALTFKSFVKLTDDLVDDLTTSMFNITNLPTLIDIFYTNDNSSMNHSGAAMFFHHVLLNDKYKYEMPLVYRKDAIFQFLAPFIIDALRRKEDIFVSVSLNLLEYSTNCLADNSLCEDFSVEGLLLLQGLSNIMIWSETEAYRMKSKELFDILRTKFLESLQYELYGKIYDESKHPGFMGYIITLMKESLSHIIKGSEMTVGNCTEVVELSRKFLQIELGQTDVLHESDRIMAGLNFARYWLLYNREIQHKMKLEETLQLIQRCIQVSLESLNKCQEKSSENNKSGVPIELVIPGGTALDQMPDEDKNRAIFAAHSTLDMMSCVIARIFEILDDK